MLPARGNVTASAKPVATAASTALPPLSIEANSASFQADNHAYATVGGQIAVLIIDDGCVCSGQVQRTAPAVSILPPVCLTISAQSRRARSCDSR